MSESNAVGKLCGTSPVPCVARADMQGSLCDVPGTIRALLQQREPLRLRDARATHRRAGVLVPLVEDEAGFSVIFTKRTSLVPHHKGQISFPGGKYEREDGTAQRTALREAYEEIGLHPEDVDILGRMDDTITLISRFVVHPFVGLVPPSYPFHLNSAEVERLVKVPLDLFHPARVRNCCDRVEYEGAVYRTKGYVYGDVVIWGATARIMDNLMRIIACNLDLPPGKR